MLSTLRLPPPLPSPLLPDSPCKSRPEGVLWTEDDEGCQRRKVSAQHRLLRPLLSGKMEKCQNQTFNPFSPPPPRRHWYLPGLLHLQRSPLPLVQRCLLGAAHSRGSPVSGLRSLAQHFLRPTSRHGPVSQPAPRQRLPQPPGRAGRGRGPRPRRRRRRRQQQQQQRAADSQ